MRRFEAGDRIRIDIPDKMDPDHERLHGNEGTIVEIITDEAGKTTGDERDSYLFSIAFDNGQVEQLRWRDIRPAHDL